VLSYAGMVLPSPLEAVKKSVVGPGVRGPNS
jgi:hypothetical protein